MKVILNRVIMTIAAIMILVTASIMSAPDTLFTQTAIASTTAASENASQRVAIGEGSNATVQYYTFTPQTVEINAGESVTWVSPAELSDIHTVTFVLDPNVQSDIILPFAVSGDTNFELVPPFNLGEPVMIQGPDGRQAFVAINKYAWHPAVVDSNNQAIFLDGTDIQYTMVGTEKVINSGIVLTPTPPAAEGNDGGTATGQPPMGPPFPPVSSFTVTFEQPGTYPYFCAIHPWMSGQVIVRGGGENQGPATVLPPPSSPQPEQQQQQGQSDSTSPSLTVDDSANDNSVSSGGDSSSSSFSSSSRCPDGYHRSPSGDCERVTDTTGMPRCPDGYHRSPDGDCEYVG